jgi:hypothetical protein
VVLVSMTSLLFVVYCCFAVISNHFQENKIPLICTWVLNKIWKGESMLKYTKKVILLGKKTQICEK